MDKPQEVDPVVFIAHDQAAIVLQPGKGPLDFPAPLCPPQGASILRVPQQLSQHALLLTVNQTADMLSISDDQVYRLLRRGELTSLKIGRLRRIPLSMDVYAKVFPEMEREALEKLDQLLNNGS